MADEDDLKRKTINRSPPFPFIALDRALQRMQELMEYSKGHPVRVQSAVQAWGYNPKSSGGIQTVGALKGFGLIDDSGSGDDRRVFLSELGKRLSRNPPADVKAGLLREAALNPKLIAEYWDVWGVNRPPDNDCRWELVDARGFTEDAAAKFLSVYDATLAFANLGHSLGEHSQNRASEEVPSLNDTPQPERPNVQNLDAGADVNVEALHSNSRRAVFPLSQGDVTLIFPATLNAEGYEELGDYLEIFLKRARRGLRPD